MANKEDVVGFIKDVDDDVKARMENLEAVKGKVFSDSVMTCLAIHSIFEVGSSHLPRQFRMHLLAELTGKLIVDMLNKSIESPAERLEIIAMVKNINESMTNHATRLTEMVKGLADDQE